MTKITAKNMIFYSVNNVQKVVNANEIFDVDDKTADSLVKSGAAAYLSEDDLAFLAFREQQNAKQAELAADKKPRGKNAKSDTSDTETVTNEAASGQGEIAL